ncbi:phytoene/squalene synthase family protein [Rhodoligotrophos appendicifer]|uniref:phytoene/squalene synthase family protein n=1 Tax=Rhodoligotrophos appendicifer TaxID=987056 RepID=UPI0014788A52
MDKDRFLAALFADDEKRPSLLALYAFDIELRRIRDLVSEPMLGEIRLQWWADALDRSFNGATGDHPVLEALAPALSSGAIGRTGPANLIEARRFDLYDDPMPSQNDLEGYLGDTSSALMQMAALTLIGKDADSCAEVSGLAGVAFGLTSLLRAMPLLRSRGQCFLPQDLLASHGMTVAHVLSGRWDGPMQAAVSDLVSLARRRLDEARSHVRKVPEAALPAFLPAALVPEYLRQLTRGSRNPLKITSDIGPVRRQWQLWRSARRKTF